MPEDFIAISVPYPFSNEKDQYGIPKQVKNMTNIEKALTSEASLRNILSEICLYWFIVPQSNIVLEQVEDISKQLHAYYQLPKEEQTNSVYTSIFIPDETRNWLKELILNAAHNIFITRDNKVEYVSEDIAVLCVGIAPNFSYQMFTGGTFWGGPPNNIFESLLILSYTKAFDKPILD